MTSVVLSEVVLSEVVLSEVVSSEHEGKENKEVVCTMREQEARRYKWLVKFVCYYFVHKRFLECLLLPAEGTPY
jgi:hypothetical protein